MTTWVLARLRRATRDQATAADAIRMSLAGLPADRAQYIACLRRIYGYEVPIEAAFAMTAGLAETVDLRSRRRARLLKADLRSLGVAHPGELGVLQLPPRFRSTCEALGWMYVVDRSALLHGVLQRHVAQLPGALAKSTSYLTNGGRGAGPRLVDLGIALDDVVQTPEMADQVIEAAKLAFAAELAWFDEGTAAARGTTMTDSHPHLSKLDEQLVLWSAKLDVVSATAKIESRKHLDELESKLVAARAKLDEAKVAGSDKWDSLKDTVANTWKDLEGAFAKLVD